LGEWVPRKLLRVNLSSSKIKPETIPTQIYKDFLGGKGFSAQLIFKELKAHTDPLSEMNKLVFMTGPLTGTVAPAACKFSVATRSPLTGAWLDAHCGGFWGPELRFAGYEGIIIEGRALKPIYLHIEDGQAEIRDASDLWGKSTFETMEVLRNRHKTDRTVRVASIGQYGEKLGLLASIIADVRAVGRGGSGAVMGSKNLKAISVVGHAKVEVDHPDEFREACNVATQKIRENEVTSVSLPNYGTANIALAVNEAGGWPTRNFQSGYFNEADEVSGEAFSEDLWDGGRAWKPCFGCTIRCSHVSKLTSGKYARIVDEGPEYETIWAFGPQCGISNREAIAAADYYSDYYGIDTISLGNTVGFLMECYEKGLITSEESNGVELRFGNDDALLDAVHAAGHLEGELGKLAGNGVKRASEHIGKGSEKFAMHVKGLEIPAYDPRSAQGIALSYMLADRGACHLRPWTYGAEWLGTEPRIDPFTIEDKPAVVKAKTEAAAIIDSVGICMFATFAISVEEDLLNLTNAATGFEFSREEFMLIGERINNLTRSFNVREGFTSKDDKLPWRVVNEPAPKGGCKGMTAKAQEMLQRYYRISGWTADGIPKRGKLKQLGLSLVVDELYPRERE